MPNFLMQFDEGKEFRGEVIKYFKGHKVLVRYARPNRHRQQSHVERFNRILGQAIFYKLHNDELKNKETSTSWVGVLPEIISIINKHRPLRKPRKPGVAPKPVRCQGDPCTLLDEGIKVRIILDQPRETTGIKLTGPFRAADVRFENQIRTVEEIILLPNQPPMYRVSGINNAWYTKGQLQVVK